MFIFMCSKASATPILRYPTSVNCADLKSTYNQEQMRKLAILEARYNQPLIDAGNDTAFMGYTQCFCADEKTAK
jgi:hypothetical protein